MTRRIFSLCLAVAVFCAVGLVASAQSNAPVVGGTVVAAVVGEQQN